MATDQKTKMFCMRRSEKEARLVKVLARYHGISDSELVRRLVEAEYDRLVQEGRVTSREGEDR